MKDYQNSYKLKIALATVTCGEGDFVRRGVLTLPLHYQI